jgi:hypothetical protein
MTEAVNDHPKKQPMPEIVRNRIVHLQERLDALENGARGRIVQALTTGNTKLRELDEALARVSRGDWAMPDVRRQLDELRARAGSIRENARKRVVELPGSAVAALASGTRGPIQNLTNGLAEITKRIEARPKGNAEQPKA